MSLPRSSSSSSELLDPELLEPELLDSEPLESDPAVGAESSAGGAPAESLPEPESEAGGGAAALPAGSSATGDGEASLGAVDGVEVAEGDAEEELSASSSAWTSIGPIVATWPPSPDCRVGNPRASWPVGLCRPRTMTVA
ncbi:hypothetical protein [Cryptosporangium arvum]|uniref:hypothetical protein n=1 Tax=Cryptosporangium arvum TaxID=80871 RepID=UPI0012EEB361|nr:hypothetical protein [Cryptosporangium arvum]